MNTENQKSLIAYQASVTRIESRSNPGLPDLSLPGLGPRLAVIAWDLGHNPLGRAYLLTDILRNDYDVELLGAQFPRFGNGIWEPLRNCSRVTMKRFPGVDFPAYFKHMEDIAETIDGDIIYVSKPRLPSLELAILAKLHRNRPIILDLDDYELGWFKNREMLTLETVKTRGHERDFYCPHGEIWTRYSESLIPLFKQITVSNKELRKKFAGMILPHARDEFDFDPTAYPREAIRTELGFTPNDKVISFAGTLRIHKGVAQIIDELKRLNRPDYKLLVIGSPADEYAYRFINSVDPAYVRVIPSVSFHDLPGYLCAADLICLFQDKSSVTSLFQMPAKLTDALAMGIPVLASNVPPLMNLAGKGLVELLDHKPPHQKIDAIFTDFQTYRRKAERNRKIFLTEYSYGANRSRLKDMIDSLLDRPDPIPDAFRELINYHREIFSSALDLPRISAKVVTISHTMDTSQ